MFGLFSKQTARKRQPTMKKAFTILANVLSPMIAMFGVIGLFLVALPKGEAFTMIWMATVTILVAVSATASNLTK